MRTVTVTYDHVDGHELMTLEDADGDWVQVQFDGEKAYFLSRLADDAETVVGSCHSDDARGEAFSLMGML